MRKNRFEQYIDELITTQKKVILDKSLMVSLEKTISLIKHCFDRGNKILIAGNGGSAADSQHFAAEIVGRFNRKRKAYPAIALTTDTSFLTAWSNDYDFKTIFSRQLEALGKPDDIFIAISTSGKSLNLIDGLKKAKVMGLKTISFLGKNGGTMKSYSDVNIIIPSKNTSHIQELHISLIHAICLFLEKNFKP